MKDLIKRLEEGKSWNPPSVSRIDVPEDADEWQLYDDMEGAEEAAKTLTKVMKDALAKVGKKVTWHKTDRANAKELDKIVDKVNKVRYKLDDYGAGDTECRVVMLVTFEEYIKLYLDKWEYPETFEVLGG